jgi:hypothetical protein
MAVISPQDLHALLTVTGNYRLSGSGLTVALSPPPPLIMLSCKELALHACEPSLLFYDSSMLGCGYNKPQVCAN